MLPIAVSDDEIITNCNGLLTAINTVEPSQAGHLREHAQAIR